MTPLWARSVSSSDKGNALLWKHRWWPLPGIVRRCIGKKWTSEFIEQTNTAHMGEMLQQVNVWNSDTVRCRTQNKCPTNETDSMYRHILTNTFHRFLENVLAFFQQPNTIRVFGNVEFLRIIWNQMCKLKKSKQMSWTLSLNEPRGTDVTTGGGNTTDGVHTHTHIYFYLKNTM